MEIMERIQMRELGRTGLSVSPIGFGAAQIGLLKTDQQQINSILNQLLDAGINFIDTAAAHAGSEEAIGKAVSHRRDQYILVSKCGQSVSDLSHAAWSPQIILSTIDRALKRLKTDRLDIMLLHSCELGTLQRGEAIEALVKARDAGKIRFAGYSGDNEAAAFAAAHPQIAVVETSISIVDQANIDSVLPLTQKHKTGVIAKRPLANAAWRPLEAQPGLYQEYAEPYYKRFRTMGLRIDELGLEPELTDWAEVALRFTLAQPGVHTAIIGTTNPQNALRNVQISAKGPPPGPAIQRIRQAFARARQHSGEPWPGLT